MIQFEFLAELLGSEGPTRTSLMAPGWRRALWRTLQALGTTAFGRRTMTESTSHAWCWPAVASGRRKTGCYYYRKFGRAAAIARPTARAIFAGACIR